MLIKTARIILILSILHIPITSSALTPIVQHDDEVLDEEFLNFLAEYEDEDEIWQTVEQPNQPEQSNSEPSRQFNQNRWGE